MLHQARVGVPSLGSGPQVHLGLVGPVAGWQELGGVPRGHHITTVQPLDAHLGGVEAPHVAGEEDGVRDIGEGRGDDAELGRRWSKEGTVREGDGPLPTPQGSRCDGTMQ